jgi:hypothetical protein
LISKALDQTNRERQLASKAIADLSGVVVKREQVERAFTVLLERVEDLFLDVPDILALLSCFVARAVSDEALSPAFLLRVDLFASDMGYRVRNSPFLSPLKKISSLFVRYSLELKRCSSFRSMVAFLKKYRSREKYLLLF